MFTTDSTIEIRHKHSQITFEIPLSTAQIFNLTDGDVIDDATLDALGPCCDTHRDIEVMVYRINDQVKFDEFLDRIDRLNDKADQFIEQWDRDNSHTQSECDDEWPQDDSNDKNTENPHE